VLNIQNVKVNLLGTYNFNYTKDHSKWAVSLDSSLNVTCLAGINRQNSQNDRGGGALCFWNNANVAEAYRGIIGNTEKCA
jgi:deoxyribonuclease-2